MKFHGEVPEKRVQCLIGSKVSSYISQLRLVNMFPLLTFQQWSEFLLLVKMSNESNQLQFQENENLGRLSEIFKLPFTGTEKAEGEFTLRTCRLTKNLRE